MAVTGEIELFRIREHAGGYMHLGYVPPRPPLVTREEHAHPPGPGDLFVLTFLGMVSAHELLVIGERFCREARLRLTEDGWFQGAYI